MSLPAEAMQRFQKCMDEAAKAGEFEPTAMTLATPGDAGAVSARMVLLKDFDERGFVFYTNLNSAKGRELSAHPRAALVFYWKTINRQVRVEGPVELIDERQADEYFATRPRGAQLGAWASRQSEPLPSRARLIRRVLQAEARYMGRAVPRPPHWSGYRVVPEMIEFWYGKSSRLHDRFRFSLHDGHWQRQRLYP